MSFSEAVNRQFYSIPLSADDEITNSNERSSLNSTTQSESRSLSTEEQDDVTVLASLSAQNKLSHGFQPGEDFLKYIADSVIGSHKTFSGPFGLRPALYLDFVASGRALEFIEDYIRNEVLPEYGNTHTTTSITSLQTTLFRHEARDIIRNACNASEHDSVIFAGSGTTGAMHKLVHGLNVNKPSVVLTGPYEHHSNILPWMEVGAKIVRISETDSGRINLAELEECLETLKGFNGQVFGAFSAASNVTGILTNVNEVTILLHKHGALAFWDYAAAAPYVKVDINPYVGGSNQPLVYKDAIYFSMHKFVGGVDCPGVLIAKKKLFQNPAPSQPGGGTVFFVRRDSHRYLQEPEMREEGGTPSIVGSIRAGLVFQLRESVGTDLIDSQDTKLLIQAKAAWSNIQNLVILGPSLDGVDRLPIFSLMVYHPMTGRFLHHNFVAAILNDVFGIQSRGGCACAGPYAMDLLGIKESVSQKIEQLLAEDSNLDRSHLRRVGEYSHREFIRPGFVRINLPYFLDQDSVTFVLEAVSLVAEHAWKLLPQYLFNPETGEWRHKQFQTFKDRKWLGHISYSSGKMSFHQPPQVVKGPLPSSYQECIQAAKDIFAQAEKIKMKLPDQTKLFDDDVKPFRWFVLPSEAYDCLKREDSQAPVSPSQLPFCPPNLLLRLGQNVPLLTNGSAIQNVKDLISQHRSSESERRGVGDEDPLRMNIGRTIDNSNPSYSSDSTNNNALNGSNKKMTFSEGMACALEEGFAKDGNSIDAHDEIRDIEDKINALHVVKDCKDEVCSVPTCEEIIDKPQSIANNSSKTMTMTNVNGNASLVGSKASAEDNTSMSLKEDRLESKTKESSNICNSNSSQGKKEKISKWFPIPKPVFKKTVTAMEEYEMLQDGDKVLICLSGGKDSLSLLHTVRQFKFYAKGKGINFEFGAVTIDPQTPSYDPSPLKDYLASLDVPYFYESQCIMETANNLPYECASICSFCSRMKRGRIYAAARREGYNVLALGQHLDDLAESFMMSYLHNGALNTMKAHYTVKEGDLRVIRPFIYVREIDLRNFAEKNKLPVIAENCPACFEAPKERHRIKQLLAAQEVMFPQVYQSMLSAMKPLMARKRKIDPDLSPPQSDASVKESANTPDEDDFNL